MNKNNVYRNAKIEGRSFFGIIKNSSYFLSNLAIYEDGIVSAWEKFDIYQFEKYPEDEFWILTDVDQNWSNQVIDPQNGKTYKDEWDDAIAACEEKGYHYAISNPFFEIWLLLHHDQPSEEDKSFAVSDSHSYEKTSHFRTRLSELGAPLKDKKHINSSNYNDEKIKTAVHRAEELHVDKTDMCPRYFATTVYLLLKKIFEMLPEEI